jgi:hypothetical protein
MPHFAHLKFDKIKSDSIDFTRQNVFAATIINTPLPQICAANLIR